MLLIKPVIKKAPPDTGRILHLLQQPGSAGMAGALTHAAKAGLVVTHLAAINQLESLNLDNETRRKVDHMVAGQLSGSDALLDAVASKKVLKQFEQIKDKPFLNQPAASAVSFTDKTLVEGAYLAIYRDSVKTAQAVWTNKEVDALLSAYGLPVDASLSVLAVEVFGNITNFYEHAGYSDEEVQKLTERNPKIYEAMQQRRAASRGALGGNLGNYRILRTSPLTEVPFVCCTA